MLFCGAIMVFTLVKKNHWAKRTLWEESTRVPLLISGPGISPDIPCEQSVSLIDIYPTLIDLCSLPENEKLEGVSLVPQLENSKTVKDRPSNHIFIFWESCCQESFLAAHKHMRMVQKNCMIIEVTPMNFIILLMIHGTR